jgi:arabinan endo-1,5-alpha-L-arabinosidase
MRTRLLALALLIGTRAWAQQPAPDPDRVHDPAIIKEGSTYYLFGTGRGIPMHRSTDLVRWVNG